MGWLFKEGCSRRQLIAERIEAWENKRPDGVVISSTCLANCYRGGCFSGVLWSVWERTYARDGEQMQPIERWIQCDLLRFQRNYGWGYKDMEESMHPYFYSCPQKYLALVPIDKYGGCEAWREFVRQRHAGNADKRRARRAARKPTESN